MTHLPFVAGAYGVTVALAAWLSASALLRLRRARRRLQALDSRTQASRTRASRGRR